LAIYNLDQFSIFLVEDNSYIRTIVTNLLNQFRVGKVTTAADGAEAIEVLKSQKKGAGSGGFDIVISDLMMTPIDGLLLLRWIRTAKESPNRFLPFVMLSGAADNEYVTSARDLGVSEFLAKPFSGQSVYRKILEVIDRPRPFFATTDYFGPDRRRRREGERKKEQRTTTDDDITIVHSTQKVSKPEKDSDVWCFRLTNNLQAKAGGDGISGLGEIPTALLEEAEDQLERAALDFTEWAANYLTQLSALCTETQKTPDRRAVHFEEINLLAHELRGQGGTFGYPLITTFAKMLYDATRSGGGTDDADVEIVKAHIDAMRAVIREKVAGDGGDTGRALLKSLELAIERQSGV
jgi:CheY-like chemotaxis protein